MVRATGQLDLDEQGHWDFHGHSSGLSFIRRLKEHFGEVVDTKMKATPFVKSRFSPAVFESPSMTDAPTDWSLPCSLPPLDIALQLCEVALEDASALYCVLHKPTFYTSVRKLYDTPPHQYTDSEHRFLPLFYAVLAVAYLYSKDEHGSWCREDMNLLLTRGW